MKKVAEKFVFLEYFSYLCTIFNSMTQEELIKFLKENLKIKVTTESCWETNEVCVSLYLGKEEISSDYFSI